jgi:hypothetical protein
VIGKWGAATTFFMPAVAAERALVLHVLEYGPFLDADLAFGPVFAAYLGMFLLSGHAARVRVFREQPHRQRAARRAAVRSLFNFGLMQPAAADWRGQLGPHLGDSYYVRELLDKFDVMRNFARLVRARSDRHQPGGVLHRRRAVLPVPDDGQPVVAEGRMKSASLRGARSATC